MYEDGQELTQEQISYFLERMDSGEEVEAGSDVHQLMTAASERAMRITSRMNAEFNSLFDTREQLGGCSCARFRKAWGCFRLSRPTAG